MSQGEKTHEPTMQAEPRQEHVWLQQLVGDWTYEAEALIEPGKPSETCTGSETVRSVGGLWILAEGTGGMPGGGRRYHAAYPRL